MYFLYYFCFISVVSALVFAFDKYRAKQAKWRVPEATLHMLEAAGGVVAVLVLMYTIRHKNAKFSYYGVTYLILVVWLAALFLVWKYLL